MIKIKRILVISSSPRRNSHSMSLCTQLLKTAPDDYSITTYSAYSLAALPCTACGYCETHRGCAKHDLDKFMSDYEAADYFIIASPVYNGGLPAPLKAVVDRFQRYYSLRFSQGVRPPIEKHKRAALILTAGCEGDGHEHIEKMLRQQFTVLNTDLIEVVFCGGTDKNAPACSAVEAAAEAGRKLFI